MAKCAGRSSKSHKSTPSPSDVGNERSPGGVILPNTERLEFAGNVATPDEIDAIEKITTHVQDLVTRSTAGEVPGNYL